MIPRCKTKTSMAAIMISLIRISALQRAKMKSSRRSGMGLHPQLSQSSPTRGYPFKVMAPITTSLTQMKTLHSSLMKVIRASTSKLILTKPSAQKGTRTSCKEMSA